MLLAEHPDADAFVAGLRRRKTATASRVSAETILRHRDAGRQ
jgi:hypothetical protein